MKLPNMSPDELETKLRDLAEASGLMSGEIADVLGTLRDEFDMLAADEFAAEDAE